jgi:hypothetical protein
MRDIGKSDKSFFGKNTVFKKDWREVVKAKAEITTGRDPWLSSR